MHPKRAHVPLQGLDRHVPTVGAIMGQVFTTKLEPYIGVISPVMHLHDQKKVLRRSGPVDISHWRQ